ncbi:zf-C2H2 Zinc finger, C2H2 type [Maudiozyma exigua]|uniref:Zf-C2H2 Zinc finger, C2H2 type n=1 Tax=Maudiozyma exigua TaxID=34358 RepID=A0A9P6WDU3_MAUEX|nr:zf-C2H2 Zinc finger, C2H2 type [Kazachstania exigua]
MSNQLSSLPAHDPSTSQKNIEQISIELQLQYPDAKESISLELDESAEYTFNCPGEFYTSTGLWNIEDFDINTNVPVEFSLEDRSVSSLVIQNPTQSNNVVSNEDLSEKQKKLKTIDPLHNNNDNCNDDVIKSYVAAVLTQVPEEKNQNKHVVFICNDHTVTEPGLVEEFYQGVEENIESSDEQFIDPFVINNSNESVTQAPPPVQILTQSLSGPHQDQSSTVNINTNNSSTLPTGNSAIVNEINTTDILKVIDSPVDDNDTEMANILSDTNFLQPIREFNEQNVGCSRDLQNNDTTESLKQSVEEKDTSEQPSQSVFKMRSITDRRRGKTDAKQPKPFKCSICSEHHQSPTHLKRHVDSVHYGLRPFICYMCIAVKDDYKGASRKDHLVKHLTTVHNMGKPEVKEYVDKHFKKIKKTKKPKRRLVTREPT